MEPQEYDEILRQLEAVAEGNRMIIATMDAILRGQREGAECMQHHEDILHSLTSMLAAQQTMNQTQTIVTQELREFNQHQVAINQHVTTTLARIETLLARIIPQQDNGTDA